MCHLHLVYQLMNEVEVLLSLTRADEAAALRRARSLRGFASLCAHGRVRIHLENGIIVVLVTVREEKKSKEHICRGREDERDRSDVIVAHHPVEASSSDAEGSALYYRHKVFFLFLFCTFFGKAPALTRCTFK